MNTYFTYNLKIMDQNINKSDLILRVTREQFESITKKPFFSEKEILKFSNGSLTNYVTKEKVVKWRYQIEINEMGISDRIYSNNSVKIRLEYTSWNYYEGDNEIPRNWYPSRHREFFIIDSGGIKSKSTEEQDETESFKKIDFNK